MKKLIVNLFLSLFSVSITSSAVCAVDQEFSSFNLSGSIQRGLSDLIEACEKDYEWLDGEDTTYDRLLLQKLLESFFANPKASRQADVLWVRGIDLYSINPSEIARLVLMKIDEIAWSARASQHVSALKTIESSALKKIEGWRLLLRSQAKKDVFACGDKDKDGVDLDKSQVQAVMGKIDEMKRVVDSEKDATLEAQAEECRVVCAQVRACFYRALLLAWMPQRLIKKEEQGKKRSYDEVIYRCVCTPPKLLDDLQARHDVNFFGGDKPRAVFFNIMDFLGDWDDAVVRSQSSQEAWEAVAQRWSVNMMSAERLQQAVCKEEMHAKKLEYERTSLDKIVAKILGDQQALEKEMKEVSQDFMFKFGDILLHKAAYDCIVLRQRTQVLRGPVEKKDYGLLMPWPLNCSKERVQAFSKGKDVMLSRQALILKNLARLNAGLKRLGQLD